MAVTSGFFDAQLVGGTYDRLYDSSDFGRMFDGIINDGVFGSMGDKLKVTASTGMTVNVGLGKAWFDGVWLINSAIYPVTIDGPSTPRGRIDAVVLDIDKRTSVRAGSIKYVKGTPATSPTRPTLINETNHTQYALAYIQVNSGVSSITQANITDMRGTSGCPFVSAVNPSITADELISQWANRFNTLYTQMETAIAQAGERTLLDHSVSAIKIQNGAILNSMMFFALLTNVTWTLNTYGTYTGVCHITNPAYIQGADLDPDVHFGILSTVRKMMKPGDSAEGLPAPDFYQTSMDEEDEELSNIFSCQISGVNTITMTARVRPTHDVPMLVGGIRA